MSTDIGTVTVTDIHDKEYALELYAGTGGIALFIHRNGEGTKLWLDKQRVHALIGYLQEAAEARGWERQDSTRAGGADAEHQ